MKNIIFEEFFNGLAIDRIVRDYEYNMSTKHVHDEYEIYYLLEGERYYFIENQTYHIKKGCLVFINHGQIHKTGTADKSYHDRILIEFKTENLSLLNAFSGDIDIPSFFESHHGVLELSSSEQHYVERLLFGIASEIHQQLHGCQLLVTMKLIDLLIFSTRLFKNRASLIHNTTSDTPKHKKVDEVATYISQNCASAGSLNSLAEKFYISKSYLSRIFKEVTGFTVNEYINIYRIKKAQTLLIEEDLNITEISQTLGYESITYFEKVFKKYVETSPLKHRKQHLKRRASPKKQN